MVCLRWRLSHPTRLRFAAEQRREVACGKTAGQWQIRRLSCGAATWIPLRIYRRVFTGFLEVPSPHGKGEKVAGGRMRGLLAGFVSGKAASLHCARRRPDQARR